MDKNEVIRRNRELMKGYTPYGEDLTSDQDEGVAAPPVEKGWRGGPITKLPKEFAACVTKSDVYTLMRDRRSVRDYADTPLPLASLSFLLWATQGVRKVTPRNTQRTVPSAGSRHPFETYLFVNNAEGLTPGVYRYLASEHALEALGPVENMPNRLSAAFCGQTFFGYAPVAFVWTCVPYRSEWRYVDKAQKYSLLDAGHLCENLYLGCGAVGCGCCAIGAYLQDEADALLDFKSGPSDAPDDEFVVYAASVGIPRKA